MIQSVTRASSDKVKFIVGKYKGKTLVWVAENVPGYLIWFRNNVARVYWPKGFQEAYEKAFYRIEKSLEKTNE